MSVEKTLPVAKPAVDKTAQQMNVAVVKGQQQKSASLQTSQLGASTLAVSTAAGDLGEDDEEDEEDDEEESDDDDSGDDSEDTDDDEDDDSLEEDDDD